LSKARARAVATLLGQDGVRVAVVKGFGEEAPVACNRGAAGLEKNRRVEVWLK
jgi:phosphate transport system substrate-binding protein